MTARGCDICGARAREPIHRQRFAAFDDGSAFDGYDVVACSACGFVYADAIPGQAAYDRYYREMSKYESHGADGGPTAAQAGNYRAIVAEIARHLPDRRLRILDVGSAGGDLLAAFRDAGYDDVTGFDPSPRCAEQARARYGIEVVATPISQMRFGARRFDLILLSSVLEHLRDLRATVAELAALLAPRGAIWFEVPDASRFAADVASPFQQFSLEHINFFTAATLRSLLGTAGCAPLATWSATRALGAIEDPALDGIFLPTSGPAPAVRNDRSGPDAVRDYVQMSRHVCDRLCEAVEPLARSDRPVVIWGTGSLTLHLLTDPRFRRLRITAFVDRNRNYHGKAISGVPVIAPEALAGRCETILVASRVFEREIATGIRERYGLGNPVVELFGDALAGASSSR